MSFWVHPSTPRDLETTAGRIVRVGVEVDRKRVCVPFCPRGRDSTRVHVAPEVGAFPDGRPDVVQCGKLADVPLRLAPPDRYLVDLGRDVGPGRFVVKNDATTNSDCLQNIVAEVRSYDARVHRETVLANLFRTFLRAHTTRLFGAD
jgi:hypothetical protein